MSGGYPCGRGPSSLSSSYNERAGPRPSDPRRYHHPVKPATRAPHYAHVSKLYPMEAHSDFRYRPTTDTVMPGLPGSAGGISGGSGGGIVIPVVHLGSSGSTSSPSYFSTNRSSVGASPGGPLVSGPRVGSMGTGNGALLRKSSLTDPEAEVDALTSVLMQRMETPRSGGIMSPHETTTSPTGGTSSPVGGYMRRGSGGSSSGSSLIANRMPRLHQQTQQQQQRIGSPNSLIGLSNNNNNNNNNGGGGSPHTVQSPRTASPTNSSASSGGGQVDASHSLNNCFRCRRPLVPPESSTLGGNVSPPPVVTLTGALSAQLHEACFTCYLCRTRLNPQGYYHSLHRLLCPTCVRDGAVESCENCKRPIGDRIVRALGTPYHPGCFVCSICQTHLDAKPFTVDVHGRPLCLEDFHKRYAPRCAICSRPIAPEAGSQEARRVVAGNANYHLECYGVMAAQTPGGSLDSPRSTPTPSMV